MWPRCGSLCQKTGRARRAARRRRASAGRHGPAATSGLQHCRCGSEDGPIPFAPPTGHETSCQAAGACQRAATTRLPPPRSTPSTSALAALSADRPPPGPFSFGDRLRVDPMSLGENPQALLTMLYCPTHRLRRRGAPVENPAHSASLAAMGRLRPPHGGSFLADLAVKVIRQAFCD